MLLVLFLARIGVVMADSVPSLHTRYGRGFIVVEWAFTIVFTLEYLLRMACVKRPAVYLFSVLGLIDLPAVVQVASFVASHTASPVTAIGQVTIAKQYCI